MKMITVLVVEDSVIQQRILGYTLRKNGYKVIQAGNGQEALDCLATTPVDVMISDISMPQMNGLDLLKYLRQNKGHEYLPIIMLTASGQDQDRKIAQAAGANYFLTKPVSSTDLITTVKKVFEESENDAI